MLTKIARSLRIRRANPPAVAVASMPRSKELGLTPAEADHWRAERQYWRDQFKAWLELHGGSGLHALQDDDATVVGQLQQTYEVADRNATLIMVSSRLGLFICSSCRQVKPVCMTARSAEH